MRRLIPGPMRVANGRWIKGAVQQNNTGLLDNDRPCKDFDALRAASKPGGER